MSPWRQGDRPQHLQVLPRDRQPLDAGLVQDQIDERRGAAVHDRHFGRVQFDDDVVDAEGGQGREQVLDGLDRHGFACEPGGVLDAAEVRDGRGDFEPPEVGALEPDPEIGRRWLERQRDLVAGMKTDSGAGHWTTKSALRVHDLTMGRWESRIWLSKRVASGSCHRPDRLKR